MYTNLAQNKWPVLIIGDYLFEPTIGLISGPGGAHHVCARTSAVLLYLAERRETVVKREQLISDLWHDAHGAGKALNHCIARLRQYLDDDAQSARYIETVPGRGYRLVAAVYESNPEPVSETAKPQTSIATKPGRSLARFILELRHRKVCRALLVYFITVWLAAQVAEIVTPALGLPEWFTSFTIMVGILGFPLTAVLAWVFDITPEGVVVDLSTRSGPVTATPRSRFEVVIDAALIACAAVLATQLVLGTFSDEASAATGAPVEVIKSSPDPRETVQELMTCRSG